LTKLKLKKKPLIPPKGLTSTFKTGITDMKIIPEENDQKPEDVLNESNIAPND